MLGFLLHQSKWQPIALWVVALATVWPTGAVAQDADWVELNHWQGNGSRQTQPFWLLGSSWVLKYQHSDGMSVDLYNLAGEKVGPVFASTSGLPGTAFRHGQGVHFLRISGAGTWNVVSQVLVSPADKWQLSQLTAELKPPMTRLAVWTGETGQEFYEPDLPPGPWRLVFTLEGAGGAETVLKDAAGQVVFGTILRQPGTAEGWGYKPGRYGLKVHAENAAWKVELFGE
ncbi:MAG: hypothetical protein WCH61_00310 [bacterium]